MWILRNNHANYHDSDYYYYYSRVKRGSAHACADPSLLPAAFSQLPFIVSMKPLFPNSLLFGVHSFQIDFRSLLKCSCPVFNLMSYAGMHSVRDHVCEWEKGPAHGQEPLLWRRELFHHPSGGGKVKGSWDL